MIQKLHKSVVDYRCKLRVQGGNQYGYLVRQTKEAFAETLEKGSIVVQQFYESRIFPLMQKKEIEDLWYTKGLAVNDWIGLTKFHLKQIFSDAFLTPMEDSSSSFVLNVTHTTASEYAKMLIHASPRDPLTKFSSE